MEDKKTKIKSICFVVLLAVFVVGLFLWSIFFDEQAPSVKTEEYYNYFNTVSYVSDYSGGTHADFKKNAALVEERLKYYHELFDIYNEYDGINNIATINRLAGEGPVKISSDLLDFLEYSAGMYEVTNGYVNIAMGAVLSIWHEHREAGVAVPDIEVLRAAAQHCDIENLVINRENMTVELLDADMSLDVGAIAKGYATEKIAKLLAKEGVSAYVLDIGGNIRAVGTKPDGSGWTTGIKNPGVSSDEAFVYRFELSDESAVTSGDYERYYVVDGVKYHHIINKDTLLPSDHFASVTVITADSGLADTLSTALFCMSYESGTALLDTLDGVKAIWVTHDGTVLEYQ